MKYVDRLTLLIIKLLELSKFNSKININISI